MAIMFTIKHKVLGFLRQINKNNEVTDTFNRFNKFLSLIEAVIYWITGKK